MKLKKLLSLVLVGVMALSILTACGSVISSADYDTVAVVADTDIVDEIEALLKHDTKNAEALADQLALLPFGGNESEHAAFATKNIQHWADKYTYYWYYLSWATLNHLKQSTSLNDALGTLYDETGEYTSVTTIKNGTTYMFPIKVSSGNSDTEVAKALKTFITANAVGKSGCPLIDTMTVLDWSRTTTYTLDVDGTVVDKTSAGNGAFTYKLVVFTTAAAGNAAA